MILEEKKKNIFKSLIPAFINDELKQIFLKTLKVERWAEGWTGEAGTVGITEGWPS